MSPIRHVTLDPVPRIEGHLRVDLTIEDGVVTAARSSGTSFRGLESVLAGRDPRDAVHLTQRICGVCPVPHAQAAALAVEAIDGTEVSAQACRLRNIIQAANFIESHILHFYVLALPDYVAGLATAGAWPREAPIKAWRGGETLDGHDWRGRALEALRAIHACHELSTIFGGKMPHTVGILVGGATARPSADDIAAAADLVDDIARFVEGRFKSDLLEVAAAFPAYETIGASRAGLLAFAAFPAPSSRGAPLFPAGVADVEGMTFDPAAVTESVASSWYAGGPPSAPLDGTPAPDPTRAGAYSWAKAPRLGGRPFEVGALARAVVAGRSVAGRGVWARFRARRDEASLLAGALTQWLAGLTPDAPGIERLAPPPEAGEGRGLTEAPRGALGHWLAIEGGVVRRYAVISPTTWNGSPRDEAGVAGPMEQALEGVAVADTKDPIEALRVVHSFDPCLQCAVH